MEISIPEPFASSLRISHHAIRGRGLVATRDLRLGEVALAERPLAWTTKSTHCQQCLMPVRLTGSSSCSACRTVAYCSKACQNVHWVVHRLECRLIKTANGSKPPTQTTSLRAALALRCALMERAMDVQSSFGSSAPTSLLTTSILQQTDAPRDSMSFAVANGFCEPRSILSHFREQLGKCAAMQSHSELDTKDEQALAELVHVANTLSGGVQQQLSISATDLHDSQIWLSRIRCNAIEMHDITFRACGQALVPTLALVNHSCLPNCVFITVDGVIQLRVIEPIPTGGELLVDYTGEESAGISTMRRHKLQSRWHFVCRCLNCTASDESASSFSARDIERIGLKCCTKGCDAYVALDQDIERRVKELNVFCSSCGWQGISSTLFVPVQQQWQKINHSIDMANGGLIQAALRAHQAATSGLGLLVSPLSLWIASAIQSQMEILRATRMDVERLRLFDRLITIFEAHFPRYHPLLTAQRVRRFEAAVTCDDKPSLVDSFVALMDATRISFGATHPMHQVLISHAFLVLRYRAQITTRVDETDFD